MVNTKVFISHSTADQDKFVSILAGDLKRAGADVFYSDWALKPGDRIRDKITEAIAVCEYFIIVLSTRSVKSKWVRLELDQAMIFDLQGKGLVIIPILIGRLKNEDIPKDIAGLLWIDFRYRRYSYETGVAKLMTTIGLKNLNTTDSPRPSETIVEKEKLASRAKRYHRDDPLAWDINTQRPLNPSLSSIDIDYHLSRPFAIGPKEALIELRSLIVAKLNEITKAEAFSSKAATVKEIFLNLLRQKKIDNVTAVALMNLNNELNLALRDKKLRGTRARTIILNTAHIMNLIQST